MSLSQALNQFAQNLGRYLTTWEQRGKLPRHADGYAYCDVYRLLIGPDLTKSVR